MTAVIARPHSLRTSEARQQDMATAYQRLMGLLVLAFVAVAAICIQLSYMAAAAWYVRENKAPVGLSGRADIVDRNGEPLARTIEARTIGIHRDQLLSKPEELAPKLAALMPERSAAQYLALLKSGDDFVYLRRRAMPELVSAVNALGEPAMAFYAEPERLYPQITLAAHVLGTTDVDGKGLMGMELALDRELRDPLRHGVPIALSIDARVQAAMESELAAAMIDLQALGATGLVLDAQTGEVISMVSLPVFNPNNVGAATKESLRNNVMQSVYELGSTFKPLSMAAAIDSGAVPNLARRFDATTPLRVGPFNIGDDHPQKRWLNLPEALVHSSNIATARIAELMGEETLKAYYVAFGFRDKPYIELSGRAKPEWHAKWGRARTMTAAFGHGLSVTPLNLANAFAAVVNGGILRPTTLRKLEPGKAPAGRRVISESTSAMMRKLLRVIVTEGTGKNANVAGYRVGGKTGTAEQHSQSGGYDRHKNVSTFVGVFPMDAPRYVVLAMIDTPRGSAKSSGQVTAAWTAAPVVAKVIARAAPMLGIYPNEAVDVPLDDIMPLLWKPKAERE